MTQPDTILIPWEEASPTASVLDVAAVVALEQRIAKAGTSLLELMTRAGHAVAEAATQLQPSGGGVVVLAGSGNNGGDGWVAAQDLADRGYAVTLVTKQAAPNLTAEPARTAPLRALEEPKRAAFTLLE
ncbi:MAG: NAD(P)H-hydrate epimerase, partial [Adlercreutzia sp.]|nr:NAD(P)H-hydrate epimerase [Adlercreutzia sp.]